MLAVMPDGQLDELEAKLARLVRSLEPAETATERELLDQYRAVRAEVQAEQARRAARRPRA
jgi:hypothetical protein